MRPREAVQAMIVDKETKRILVIYREDYYTKEYQWQLVKGGKEPKETETEALKREIKEEVGLENVRIGERIYEYSFVNPEGKSRFVSVFLVYSSEKEQVTPNEKEGIIAIKWINPEEALLILKYESERKAVEKALN